MIIHCEKCQTKFRLDDAKVTDKGVKVRCAKCKHVFSVRKEAAVEELFAPTEDLSGFSSTIVHNEMTAATTGARNVATHTEPAPSTDFALFGDVAVPGEPANFSAFEQTGFDTSAISFETDDLGLAGAEQETDSSVESAKAGEIDFSHFDFGDSDAESDSTTLSSLPVDNFSANPVESAPVSPRHTPAQGLDFSDDDMFGAVVQPPPETSSDTISFDFEGDSFAESMDMGGRDSSGKSGVLFSLESPSDAPFSLGDIDFGDELTSVAVQQVNPDDLKPSQEILFAPLAQAQEKSAEEVLNVPFPGEDSSGDQQDLPPLSIASRRKQSPLFTVLIAAVVLLVISVLGYFGYSTFSTPTETAAPESGKIALRNVKAAFIDNDDAGELLVISGDATNEFQKPRAALQVKATVFDAAGQNIATKSAYGGNPLTEEQLESLPLDKIETAMANQFGDSLANMEVAPGKAIPFVIVMANLPKGAKDFEVHAVGSTVATGKQQ